MKDFSIIGFTEEEAMKITEILYTYKVKEIDLTVTQDLADELGCDIGLTIQPGGQLALVKL